MHRQIEDVLRSPHRNRVCDKRYYDYEQPSGVNLRGLPKPFLGPIERKHILGEHRREGENLRVAGHHRRHYSRAQEAR